MSSPASQPVSRLGFEQLESRDVPTTASYVTNLYLDVLGRQPDTNGYNFWVNRIDSGATTQGQVAINFVSSTEYRTRTIVSYYQTQLGRTPSSAEVQAQLNFLVSGLSQNTLRVGFFASEEFYNRVGRDNTQFVIQLYSQILGRSGTVSEVNFWVNALNQSGGNRTALVNQFLTSTEYYQFEATFSYTFLLKRNPDSNGLTYWTVQRTNGMTVETMNVGFLASAEYFNRP